MTKSTVKFQDMTFDALDRVMEIENNSFSIPFTRDMMREEIANPRGHYTMALYEENIVGYGGFWQIGDEAHIMTIAVDGAYRKMGMGTAVIAEMMRTAIALGIVSMTLEVRVSNEPALALYRKMGFESAGLRKGYYSDNKEDAIIMWNYDISKTIGDR